MKEFIFSKYYNIKYRFIHSFHHRLRKGKCLLEKGLLKNNQTKWLDLGSSINHANKNFYFADLYPIEECLDEMKSKYFQLNISIPMSIEDKDRLGTFDFIRMQHVFEHFTFEEADIVLENCFHMLNKNGKLLITVPDLDIYVRRYLNKTLKHIPSFGPWAHRRIKANSPHSDYFSIFAHSMLHEKHLWCYNKEGLINKMKQTCNFKSIKKIGLLNKSAGIPFTHNRIQEDLCVIATKE
jgi:predicted SAM-dependent methyltransferase